MKLAEDLRRSVLQAAIEGKLTGGSREGWRFVRLDDVGRWQSGSTPSKTRPEFYGGNIPWLVTGDLNDDFIDENDITHRITETALSETSVKMNPRGSVLIAMYGATIGKTGILNVDATTNQACCACLPYEGVYNKYLFRVLQALKQTFINMAAGGAQPNISKEKIIRTIIPLPPIDEQRRIVSRLDAIMPLIAELESAENELEALERRFPGDMRDSLLQAAIEGKLTESNTDNWRWVRLGECALVGSGKTPAKDFLSSEGTIPFYRVADMNLAGNEKIMNEANTFLTEKYKGKLTPFPSVIFPKNGGAVFTNKRRFLNKPALIDLNTGFIFPTDINIEYLFYWFSSVDLSMYAVGTALPTVNASIISNLIIPLPPIDEQHKIAARLNELIPLCEALENLS